MSYSKPGLTVGLKPIIDNINLPTVIKVTTFPHDNHDSLVVATQVGEILKINGTQVQTILNIRDEIEPLGLAPGVTFDERGLIGLAFSPNFEQDGIYYIYYSSNKDRSTSPMVQDVDPCQPATKQQLWLDRTKYDHLNRLETWQYKPRLKSSRKINTILVLKQPFFNHNGINNLQWGCDVNKLILTLGDGGRAYDPFNMSQDNRVPYGKILAIDVDYIGTNSHEQPISSFNDLSPDQRRAIKGLVKGVRNGSGPIYDLPHTGPIKYVTQVGQDSREGAFAYRDTGVNLGWRSWESDQPTVSIKPCTQPIMAQQPMAQQPMTQPIMAQQPMTQQPTISQFAWNLATFPSNGQGLTININQGSTIQFQSSDGMNHDLKSSTGTPQWQPTNTPYNFPISNPFSATITFNNIGSNSIMCTVHPLQMRLNVIVNANGNGMNGNGMNGMNGNGMNGMNGMNGNGMNGMNGMNGNGMNGNNNNILYCQTFPQEAQNIANFYKPIMGYSHNDKRPGRFSGQAITGLIPYWGNCISQLRGNVVFTEWTSVTNGTRDGKGVLAYFDPDRNNLQQQQDFRTIKVTGGDDTKPQFYVALGSNPDRDRLFLGIYRAAGAAELNKGAIYEIVPM